MSIWVERQCWRIPTQTWTKPRRPGRSMLCCRRHSHLWRRWHRRRSNPRSQSEATQIATTMQRKEHQAQQEESKVPEERLEIHGTHLIRQGTEAWQRESWSSSSNATPNWCSRSKKIQWIRHLPQQIHASAQRSLWTTEKAHREGCRMGMDRVSFRCTGQNQADYSSTPSSTLLRQRQRPRYSSRQLRNWTRRCPVTRRTTHCFRKPSTSWWRNKIRTDREGTPGSCMGTWEIPPIHIRKTRHRTLRS